MSSPEINTGNKEIQFATNNYLIADAHKSYLNKFAAKLTQLMLEANVPGEVVNYTLGREIEDCRRKIDLICSKAIQKNQAISYEEVNEFVTKIKKLADDLLGGDQQLAATAFKEAKADVENSAVGMRLKSIDDAREINQMAVYTGNIAEKLKKLDDPLGGNHLLSAMVNFCRSHVLELQKTVVAIVREIETTGEPLTPEQRDRLNTAIESALQESLGFISGRGISLDGIHDYLQEHLTTLKDSIPAASVHIPSPTQSPAGSPSASPQISPFSSPSATPRPSVSSKAGPVIVPKPAVTEKLVKDATSTLEQIREHFIQNIKNWKMKRQSRSLAP